MSNVPTSQADIGGGWHIEYVYGTATVDGATVEGLHVLRVYGDITRPDALRKQLDTFRRVKLMTEGPTVLHSPRGVIARWDAP